jgi:hypothetical protein
MVKIYKNNGSLSTLKSSDALSLFPFTNYGLKINKNEVLYQNLF